MWTVSAIQMHPKGLIVCDEDATLELHVKVNLFNFIYKFIFLINVNEIDGEIL